MKIILTMNLQKKELCLDYRRLLVSFFKSSLCKSEPALYDVLYGNKKANQKSFAFYVRLNRPKFLEDRIILDDTQFIVTVSTHDYCLGIELYNCFLKQQGSEYPVAGGNEFRVDRVRVENHRQITSDSIFIRLLCPLVVRYHERDQKDRYDMFNDEKFEETLNLSIAQQLRACNLERLAENGVQLKAVNAKKVVVKTFGIQIPGSLGTFLMKGNPELLNFLHQSGMGSRRSEGFGMFEILQEGRC